MSHTPRIAIVGGGFTGATAAIELLRTLTPSFDLIIFDPDELGEGLAYGKAESFHLLNVRAGNLSVIHDRPSDFACWARASNFGIQTRIERVEPSRAFLSRRLFAAYVEKRLLEAVEARPDVRLTHVRRTVTSLRRVGAHYEVVADNGFAARADAVILATGYGRSAASDRDGRIPFAELNADEIRQAKSALFLGTGLSFVDEFLRLKSRGFRGETLAVSRHGLLPEVHRANESPKRAKPNGGVTSRALTFLATFRAGMDRGDVPGAAAVDLILAMRCDAQRLWQSLPIDEQRRFLRHLRSYWNVARHRLPPEVHAQMRHSLQSGMVHIVKGRTENLGGGEFLIRTPGRETAVRQFDFVFDCRGHRPEIGSPLILSLVSQGLARIDAHRLGLSVKENGAVIGHFGAPTPGIYALGPLGLGTLFEITAVPEIVAQCRATAKALTSTLKGITQRARSEPVRSAARAHPG